LIKRVDGVLVCFTGLDGVLVLFIRVDGVLVLFVGVVGVSEALARVLVGLKITMTVSVISGSTRSVRVAGAVGTGVFVDVAKGRLVGVGFSQFVCVEGARISLEPIGSPSTELDLTVVVRLWPPSNVNLTIDPDCILGIVVSLGSNSRT
jgi:hypothetical protein